MADPNEKKSLTDPYQVDMKVSKEESRLLINLRHYGQLFAHTQFDAKIFTRDQKYASGKLIFGKTEVNI